MGVPDAILHTRTALTDAEWAVMRRHPEYAGALLGEIAYLRPALDIPVSHHERWDGSGYPQGLRGEQIPLAARIFAVVDVWDALRSDRPYRAAWSAERTRAYLREQVGVLFDPAVVVALLAMLDEEAGASPASATENARRKARRHEGGNPMDHLRNPTHTATDVACEKAGIHARYAHLHPRSGTERGVL